MGSHTTTGLAAQRISGPCLIPSVGIKHQEGKIGTKTLQQLSAPSPCLEFMAFDSDVCNSKQEAASSCTHILGTDSRGCCSDMPCAQTPQQGSASTVQSKHYAHTASSFCHLNVNHQDIPINVQKSKGKKKNVVLWLPVAIKINCHIKLLIPSK